MAWLDKLLGRRRGMEVRDGMCVFRRREIADYIPRPQQPNMAETPPQICNKCGQPMPELLITTGGPLGDPEVWRDVPIAVDGWACVGCGVFRVPRKISPEDITRFLAEGARHGQAGRFAEAEWWFTRVTWDWPGYLPGHGNLAEATRDRLRLSPDLPDPLRRKLRERMREQYQAAVAAYDAEPQALFVAPVARAHLSLAELALEDRAHERALRALDACLALPGLANEEAERARHMRQYVAGRYDLFDAAGKTLQPYFDLMGRPPRAIETPEERARLARALEDLEQHYQLAPDNWRALWQLAKGRAALDGVAAAVPLWRRAFAAHPTEPDIAREAGLALLRSDLAAEALAVNRAIVAVRPDDASLWCNLAVCELLNGDLAQAEAALARSRQLDPADPIAAAVVTRLARSRAGAPLPRTLAEMERGG